MIKRAIFREHRDKLLQTQETLLVELLHLAKEGFPKAQEEYEKSVATWGMCAFPFSVLIR